MLANLGEIQRYAKESKLPSTGDMFGTREEKLGLAIVEMEDWPLSTKLWMERKSLGTWITAHPMQLVAGKYEKKVKHRLRDIDRLLEVAPTSEVFYFAFIVIEVRILKDKIVLIRAQDETADAEIVAFKSDCDPWWHLLKQDNILVALCSPKHSTNRSSMHFSKLHKIGELSPPGNLFIKKATSS